MDRYLINWTGCNSEMNGFSQKRVCIWTPGIKGFQSVAQVCGPLCVFLPASFLWQHHCGLQNGMILPSPKEWTSIGGSSRLHMGTSESLLKSPVILKETALSFTVGHCPAVRSDFTCGKTCHTDSCCVRDTKVPPCALVSRSVSSTSVTPSVHVFPPHPGLSLESPCENPNPTSAHSC